MEELHDQGDELGSNVCSYIVTQRRIGPDYIPGPLVNILLHYVVQQIFDFTEMRILVEEKTTSEKLSYFSHKFNRITFA